MEFGFNTADVFDSGASRDIMRCERTIRRAVWRASATVIPARALLPVATRPELFTPSSTPVSVPVVKPLPRSSIFTLRSHSKCGSNALQHGTHHRRTLPLSVGVADYYLPSPPYPFFPSYPSLSPLTFPPFAISAPCGPRLL